jgi:hypothetical protein
MPRYEELLPETYYLIAEERGADPRMVSVLLYSEKSVLLRSYVGGAEDYFKLKAEEFSEIIEELDGDFVAGFESLYREEEIQEEYISEEEG